MGNIGAADRSVRLAVGIVLAAIGLADAAGVLSPGWAVWGVALVVGVVLARTGLLRTCLLSRIVGIDTAQDR